MVLIRVGSESLGQQAPLVHVDIEIALATAMQGAGCSDDVSQIPGLDRLNGLFREGVTIEVKLNGARPILNEEEGAAVADQPTGHREPMICFLELGLVLGFKIAL